MLAIVGAGGHAKCVYECLYLHGHLVYGFFDDDPVKKGQEVINGKVVISNPEEILKNEEIDAIFIALGDNRQRMAKYEFFEARGYKCPNAIHIKAYQSPFAEIGKGNFIMTSAVLNPGSSIGNYCIVNTGATVGHDCRLENGVQIGPGVNIAGGSLLQEGVFVGIGAKIGPNVSIGAWSVVGAGAVVLQDVPANSICYGIPGKSVFNSS